ncbi:LysR family transcriptional regulator [Herbaspirillum rubrisubalbicans]|jgi:DNA-binding transcriptional LysR family regulator|uniref:LysR family transcriptional regulator n=1 Tax=Herbaspirillum rubrisubalbicans TaxID=80842 RepID=A0ABX9C5C8_9BURK|nr:LysR family transcriptional regulator [Herbaspirillum rubrisubalbicans]MCP1574516.1 DNA-binding transcriptional LysR family regulator [Herbaspirillum rubrisubalbicans]RAM65814.1 LysR family transcriptional regulator [Herbaspirillum rubrisubalbicans]RAN45174.1 LysR family transcriptional regulator [Herbaspirillum rubrisubalbicans]
MVDIEPNWEWYRTFLKVLETGSLSAAGREMGLTQPTVGRHIENLESALGLKLFVRSFEGFSPTDAALELQPYAAGIAASSAAMRRVASSHGRDVRGTVRLTASEIISVEVLPPILADLKHRHPGLHIELVMSNRADDLLQREADIAVRMFKPSQDALVAKRLGSIELGLHAHQRYLAAYGVPHTIDALADHALIGFDQESAYVRKVLEQFPWLSRASLAFRADSDLAQLAAIRAGIGIGICQVALAAREEALVHLLPRQFSLKMQTWVVMHEDLRSSPRCAVTFAALVAGLSAYMRG